MVEKDTKKAVGTIAGIGIGLGVLTKVEGTLNPAVPVATAVAPIAAVGATVVGAGLVLKGLDKLSMVDPRKAPVQKPMKQRGARSFL